MTDAARWQGLSVLGNPVPERHDPGLPRTDGVLHTPCMEAVRRVQHAMSTDPDGVLNTPNKERARNRRIRFTVAA
jgi:hypothetical protein